MKHFLAITLVIGSIGGLLFLPRSAEAISIFKPFGGRILTLEPIPTVINPLCPANVGFVIAVGLLPAPIVASIFPNTFPLVRGGTAKVGSWALGLATPAVATCLPIVILMGVSSGF